MDMDMKLEGTSKATNKGVFIYDFLLFCSLVFWDIQKLDGPKSEKLKATFHELLNFSLSRSSSFWISQKLIHKSDEKLKQTLLNYQRG
jgi:hypothetical protein